MTAAQLNRDGRPWGIPRQHINKHGEPKPALTMADAIAKALEYDIERQLDPRRRDRGPVQAYECGHCGHWHIGTRRRKLRKPIERIELGERAWWNLQAENGPPARRIKAIAMRTRRRGREAVSSRAA